MKSDKFAKDRLCYILAETFNYLITILLSGSYLAKVTSTLGFSDGLTAILSTLSTLGCSVQLLAIALFRKGTYKRRITGMITLSQLLFTLLYLVPFFQIPHNIRAVIFITFILLGQVLLNASKTPFTNWYMSFVDNGKRGTFTAKKEAVSLACGFLFQFGMSAMIDYWEAQGNIRVALTLCAMVIFLLSIGHTLSLIFTRDKEIPENKHPLFQQIKSIFTRKETRSLLVLSALWGMCHSVSIPFYGTYTIKELGFSMSYIAFLSLLSAVSRILASMVLGKYADKYSFAKMLRLCYCILALGFGVAVFVRPANGHILYAVYTMLNAISMGGINSGEINLIYDYVAPEQRTAALSVRNTIYGVTGFLTVTAISPLLSHIQNAGNRFLGIPVYGQQVLSAIACLAIILTAFYIHAVVGKMQLNKEQIQNKGRATYENFSQF